MIDATAGKLPKRPVEVKTFFFALKAALRADHSLKCKL